MTKKEHSHFINSLRLVSTCMLQKYTSPGKVLEIDINIPPRT